MTNTNKKHPAMTDSQLRGFAIGSLVNVRHPIVGPDGYHGVFTVINRSGDDYAVARGSVSAAHVARGDYDVWIHAQRLTHCHR